MTPFDDELDQLLSQAEALLEEDKPDEALALLERARQMRPSHAWIMLFRGVALGQMGRVDEATEQLLTAADAHLDDIDIQVDAARYLSLLEHYQDAVVCAGRAVELDDMDSGAHVMYAEVLERLERIPEAASEREVALSLDPDDKENRYSLAVDLCELSRYQEAFSIAQPLFDEFQDDPDIVRLEGACYSYLDRHADALAIWARLERVEGESPDLLHNRASTLDVLGRYDEALATINAAIEAEPDESANYYTRALIHEHLGEEAAAVEDYLESLTRDPNQLEAVINLVELASSIGAAATALERVNVLLEGEPNSASLTYIRGRLVMDGGDYDKGRRIIEDAVRKEPSLDIGWYTLSMVCMILEDFAGAVNASDKALQFYPEDINLWLNRGQALQQLKRRPEAMECFDRAHQIAPEDSAPLIHLGYMLLQELHRPADARAVLRQALRLQPENDSIVWMLALSCLRLGQHDEAYQQVTELLTRDPANLWGRLVSVALSAQRGDMNTAFADLEFVLDTHAYDPRQLLNDNIFEPLWADRRFTEIMNRQRIRSRR